MRTKHLFFAALALPLAFAACNNEELVLENQPQVESTSVVGAELIAHSATVNLVEGVESRFTNGGFDGTDRLGLAWYNNPKTGGGKITDPQNTKFGVSEEKTGDIYNNALVKKDMETEAFFVNGDIYSGAYFLYFPYQKVGKVQPLTVDYTNYKQTEAYTRTNVADKQMEHALHLSHKMILSSESVDADFNIDIEASPVRAASAIGVLANLGSKGTYSDELVDLVSLKSVSVNANKVNFTTKATIQQYNLPTAVLKTDKTFDEEKTEEALVKAIYEGNVLNKLTQSATIKTLVEYDNNIADENIVLLYSFPADVTVPSTSAKIIVETNVGTFTYNSAVEGKPNYKAIEKLLQYANGEVEIGVDGEGNKVYYGFDAYNSKNASLSLTLDMEDLVLTKTISSAEQWNDLMPFYAAAGENVEVTLSKDITFTEAEPFTLAKGIDVTVKAGTKKIYFEGNQTISKNFLANVDVVVAEDATLNVPENVIFVAGNITNEGIINVAEDAEIKGYDIAGMTLTNAKGIVNCSGKIVTNMEIANNEGVINVTYGKTYIDHDGNGIIAGILDGNDTEISKDYVAAIYKMIPENTNSAVNCNQLTLKNLAVKLNDETSPWSEVDYAIHVGTFADINLILENSSLTSTDAQMQVKNIEATNSPITGQFIVYNNLKSTGSTLAGLYDVTGNMTVATATLTGTSNVGGNLNAATATLIGEYNVTGNAKLDKVTVSEQAGYVKSTIKVIGDLEIVSASNFTCTALTAEDVEINESGTTKFLGTTLDAATLTINKSTLQLNNHSHRVAGVTTIVNSHIKTTGKIKNENSGKVDIKGAGCTITENYAPINQELIDDQANMQTYVNALIAATTSPEVTNMATLVEYLNTIDQATFDTQKGYNSVKLLELVKKYLEIAEYTFTIQHLTVNDMKAFENSIGKKIQF